MDDNETVVCVRAESVLDGSEIVCRTAELETVELEEGRGSVLMPAGFDVGFAVWICHTPRLRAHGGYRSLVRRVICPKWCCADSEI